MRVHISSVWKSRGICAPVRSLEGTLPTGVLKIEGGTNSIYFKITRTKSKLCEMIMDLQYIHIVSWLSSSLIITVHSQWTYTHTVSWMSKSLIITRQSGSIENSQNNGILMARKHNQFSVRPAVPRRRPNAAPGVKWVWHPWFNPWHPGLPERLNRRCHKRKWLTPCYVTQGPSRTLAISFHQRLIHLCGTKRPLINNSC